MFKMSYFRAEGGRHCVVGRGRKEGEGVGKGREGEDNSWKARTESGFLCVMDRF